MQKNYLFIFIYLLSFGISCGDASKPNAPQNNVVVKKSENEDNLLVNLASELITNPQTQAEKDKNTILNHLMDKGIEAKPTSSGLYYQIINEGEGNSAKWGDWIAVHYKGYTLDGKEFDSSYQKGKAMEGYIGNMIPGWNEGLELLKPGGKALFLIPSALAYGEKGFRKVILPNTVLAFELELVSVGKK